MNIFCCLTCNIDCDTLSSEGGDVLSVALSLRLPDDIKKYLQEQAQENRTSMGHYIVMLIDKDMKENESKPLFFFV